MIAAAAVAAALLASPGADAHRFALDVARLGPRPAASRAEGRAHAKVARRFRRAGLRVAVQRFAVPGRGRSRNVIGTFDTPARCLRVVMAHSDTTPAGPGANDNASGVGVVAALAPRLRRLRPRCDVWLVATGAEERVYTGSPDHLGSLALARRIRARRLHRRLRWALSLDEVGRDRPFWLRSPARRPRRGVEADLIRASRARIRWVREEGTGSSDHREFELLGMPGMKLGAGAEGEPCRHAACDRPNRLLRSSLRAAQRIAERALGAR